MKLLQSKIFIPPSRTDKVYRERLLTSLDEGNERKLTLLSAPAGFGKTTLLTDWLSISNNQDRSAWLSIDTSDNDPVQFWFYLIASMQSIEGNFGKDISEALSSTQPPPLDPMLVDLLNEISRIERPVTMVLDDYHLITEPKVNSGVQLLLENIPDLFHLVVSTRADPPWNLNRLRAGGEIIELRAEDLRFTQEEVTEFLNVTMGLDLSSEDVLTLDKRTEGWVAGLQLVAISMRNQDPATFIKNFSASHKYILDFLVEEVLEHQPEYIRLFLMMTSILDRFNTDLCDTVTERSDSYDQLEYLEKSNLFLLPLDDDRNWYRYHHIFSELLQNQLKFKNPELLPILHQRASEWYEEEGFIDESISHAFASKDNRRVARLVEKYAPEMLQQNKYNLLSSWIEALPEEIIISSASLCVYKSWTRHWVGLRDGGEDYLLIAENLRSEYLDGNIGKFYTSGQLDENSLPGYVSAVRSHYAVINEDIQGAKVEAQYALDLLPEDDYYTRGSAAVALGAAHWGSGDVVEAEKAFMISASNNIKGGFDIRAASSLCYASMQQIKQARLLEAQETLQEALQLASAPGGRYYPVAGYPMVKMAELFCEWNRLEEARQLVDEGVELCTQLGHVDLQAEGLIASVRVSIAEGNYTQAKQIIAKIDHMSRESKLDSWIIPWLDDSRIRGWLATGRINDAVYWVERTGLSVNDEFNYQRELEHINLARVLAEKSIIDQSRDGLIESLELLDRLRDAAFQASWHQELIRIHLLRSKVDYALGNNEDAIKNLIHAINIAEPGGYIRTFISEGSVIELLLRQILVSDKHIEYISHLLLAFKDVDVISGVTTISTPLTDREIQVLYLLATHLSVPDIANELYLSPHTIRSHVKNIYSKLGVHGRLAAVQKAKESGLLR